MMNKKLVILGAGESGLGAAFLGKKIGYEVFISDKNNIEFNIQKILDENKIHWESGQHSLSKIKTADFIIKSPGIPSNLPLITSLKSQGKTVISEIEFAAKHTSATLIGITGTNGKTTTTLLTYQILKDAGFNVGIAGNIGKSFALQVAQLHYDYYVLEISSFKLDDIINFAPHISVITSISPDHLDRYNYQFDNYIKAKLNIVKNQTKKDFFLFNSEDMILRSFLKKQKTQTFKNI